MQKSEKRKRIENKIYEIISYLDDNKKTNLNNYKDYFDNLTEEQFGDFCNWCNDPDNLDELDHTIYIQAQPFEEPKYENILKGLESLNVPAEEYVYFKDFDNDTPIRSRYPIPVGYLAIKRMEQLLSKKNRYSLDTDERSIKTDQVTGDSKVASISDLEANALLSQTGDLENIFKELYGPRSSDERARNNLYREIELNGYATLDTVLADSTLDDKVTLNTLNTYLLAAGLRTDLITNSLKLPYTVEKELNNGKR